MLITMYGFKEELEMKYKTSKNDNEDANKNDAKEAIARFAAVFRFLPLAAVLNDSVFVCHGGLFKREDDVLLSDIAAIDRRREPPDDGLMCDLLWSDPGLKDGRKRSRRGLGIDFGPDVTKRFLTVNRLQLLVRSHEVKDRGFDVQHGGKCVTVFSAANYCDVVGNLGAVLVFDPVGSDALADDDDDKLVIGGGGEMEKLNPKTTPGLRPRFIEFAASPRPKKDKRSLNDKLAEMGLVPKAFPY